uniref:Uncharacterized protein n=1 Tax=Ixodes ricinus TaxID=34613 RepID=A0A6B0TU37_IXORI
MSTSHWELMTSCPFSCTCWSSAAWCLPRWRQTTCGGCFTPPSSRARGATTSPRSVAPCTCSRTSGAALRLPRPRR